MTIFFAPSRPSPAGTSPGIPPITPLRTSSVRYRLPNLSIVEDSNTRVLRLRQELAETLRIFGAALAFDIESRAPAELSAMPCINEELHPDLQPSNDSTQSLVSTQSDTTSCRSSLALERQSAHTVNDDDIDATALPEPLFSRPCRYNWCGVCLYANPDAARPSFQLHRVAAREESIAVEDTYEKSSYRTDAVEECRTRRCFRKIRDAAKRLVRR